MAIRNRLTELLGIEHPVLLAPMDLVSGGRLAAAVSQAGGLGLLGGGYGDGEWIEQEWGRAGNARIGCGFITWSLAQRPELLGVALAHRPAAVMLSFGDPTPFVSSIHAAGTRLICQVQTLAQAREAMAAGADVLVAQGTEAGGHGQSEPLVTLLPQVVSACRARRGGGGTCHRPGAAFAASAGVVSGRSASEGRYFGECPCPPGRPATMRLARRVGARCRRFVRRRVSNRAATLSPRSQVSPSEGLYIPMLSTSEIEKRSVSWLGWGAILKLATNLRFSAFLALLCKRSDPAG
jgi:hypothetical protein